MNYLLIYPMTGLTDQLNKKIGAHQITPRIYYTWLITAVLSKYCCGSHVSMQSMLEKLSMTPTSRSPKRYLPHRKDVFSKEEYLEVIANRTEYSPKK